MNRLSRYPKIMAWSMAMVLAASIAGCRGDRDPILGGNGGGALMNAPGPQVTLPVPATTLPGPTAGLPTGSAISAAFTQSMDPATLGGTSFLVTGPGGAPVAGAVTYADSIAVFTPAAPLAAVTTYTATITIAATNGVGAPLEGNQALPPAPSAYVWSFTTGTGPDATRPQVTLTVPATTVPGPTPGIATSTAVSAVFSKPMNPTTLTAASFTLTGPGSAPVAGAVGYASGTATFTPAAALATGTTYTATVTTAARDLSGNAMAANDVWTFTTGLNADTTRPRVALTFPATIIPGPATGVAVNAAITATFTKDMAPATITAASFTLTTPAPGVSPRGSVAYSGSSRTAIYKPWTALAANTTYTATLTPAATDLAGNQLAGNGAPLPAASTYVWTFTTGAVLASGPVNLGSAGTFGILSTSAITSTGATVINGNVALQPGSSMTGFPPGIVNGIININDTVSAQAKLDLLAAYNTAAGLPPGTPIAGGADLGALYPLGMPPGTYTSGSTMLVSTSLVLDAGGDANAVWVFQIGSALTTNIGANVTLANGAQAKNVFWACALDATVGVGTTFNGSILAGRSVTAATGATIDGRILAGATTAGTVALQSTTVNVPAQ